MLPSFPLMPCGTDSTEMRTDDGELLTLTVLHPTAHLGAWDPLLPLWTRRSWQTLRGQTDREVGDRAVRNRCVGLHQCFTVSSPGAQVALDHLLAPLHPADPDNTKTHGLLDSEVLRQQLRLIFKDEKFPTALPCTVIPLGPALPRSPSPPSSPGFPGGPTSP